MEKSQIKIILAGEGGQGIQTIAKIIVLSASKNNLQASYLPSFGVEQRGTPSVAYLVIGPKKISYPRFETANYAIVLAARAMKSIAKNINNNTILVFDSSKIHEKQFPAGKLLGLPATKMAFLISAKSFNILVAAKLCQTFAFDKSASWNSVLEVLGKKFKDSKTKEKNKKIFDLGWEANFENKIFSNQEFESDRGVLKFENTKRSGKVFIDKCKGCGLCLEVCPVEAIKFGSKIGIYGNLIPEIDIEKCIGCGKCFEICPDVAIKVENLQK